MNPTPEAYVLAQAGLRASLLVATAAFPADDWEDLRQEIVVDALQRAPKFNAGRGSWEGFIRGITRNHAAALVIRRNRRAKWECLDGDIASEPENDDVENVVEGQQQGDPAPTLHLAIDIQRVLQPLPSILQQVAQLLSEVAVSETCLQLGRSRSRVYQLRNELREAFLNAGIGPTYLLRAPGQKSAGDRKHNPSSAWEQE